MGLVRLKEMVEDKQKQQPDYKELVNKIESLKIRVKALENKLKEDTIGQRIKNSVFVVKRDADEYVNDQVALALGEAKSHIDGIIDEKIEAALDRKDFNDKVLLRVVRAAFGEKGRP